MNLGRMMGNRPKEDQDPIKFLRSGEIEIGRTAPQRQKQPAGAIKNAALIMFNKPWVDFNPAQPLFSSPHNTSLCVCAPLR